MRARILVLIVLLLLVIVFTLQNAEPLLIQLWFWTVYISKALLIFLLLAVGVVLGLIVGSMTPGKKLPQLPSEPPPQP
jgi:uncharacterized integral membrane protein